MQCAPNLTQIILYCMRPTSGFPKRSGYEVSLYKETILIHTKFILFKMNSHPVNVNALNTVVSMTTPDVSVPSCPIFFGHNIAAYCCRRSKHDENRDQFFSAKSEHHRKRQKHRCKSDKLQHTGSNDRFDLSKALFEHQKKRRAPSIQEASRQRLYLTLFFPITYGIGIRSADQKKTCGYADYDWIGHDPFQRLFAITTYLVFFVPAERRTGRRLPSCYITARFR